MLQSFAAALTATAPTFLWVAVGMLVRRAGLLPDAWVQVLSRLMFLYGLPLVLCLGAARVDYGGVFESRFLMAGALATLLVVVLAVLYARFRAFPAGETGIFVQAAYRSNLGIVGISLSASAYGSQGLALAALPVALLTVLYNIIAVPVLDTAFGRRRSSWGLLAGILRNPLVIGISIGVLISVSGVQLPPWVDQAGRLIAAVVLPLSLLCIGASLDLKAFHGASSLTLEAVLWRNLIAPVVSVTLILLLGIRGVELGVLFLLLASPVAAASFVMVVAAGGNGALAANIVVISTFISAVSVTLGLVLLRTLGLA